MMSPVFEENRLAMESVVGEMSTRIAKIQLGILRRSYYSSSDKAFARWRRDSKGEAYREGKVAATGTGKPAAGLGIAFPRTQPACRV